MKTAFAKIVLLSVVTGAVLLAALPCRAAEQTEEDIWTEDRPKWRRRPSDRKPPRRQQKQIELTEERIEQILSRLRQADPNRAHELEKLRDQEPDKFEAEIRQIVRRRFGGPGQEGPQRGDRRGGRGFRGGSGPGEEGRFEPMMRRHRQRFGEFLEWLKQEYPDQAEKFGKWVQSGSDRRRHLPPGAGTYMKIWEASKESPELAEVLKEDLELKKQRGQLLRKIKRAATEDQKRELIGELKEVVALRFDLLLRRKEIEYEQLHARLEQLRKRVEKSEAEVAKWKEADFKSKNVQSRVDDLVGGVEKFRWDD